MVVTVWPTINVSLGRCAGRAVPLRIRGRHRRLLSSLTDSASVGLMVFKA